MNYSLSNKKIKSGIFNKVAMALCQNNLLTNLFHTTRHSERRCYARRHIRFAFTRHPEALAEGATHVGMSNNNRRAAFTLAEVLITLGIIGIVAAMTIPTLISNYNKRQTVTKLKQTYSILSQALTMAQVKEGDTSTWDVGGIYGTSTDDPNFSSREATEKFVSKYLIPYVKVSKDYGYTWSSQINYDGYYNPSTNTKFPGGATGHYILLSNNVLILTGIGSSGCVGGTNPDGSCVSTEYRNIIFKVDVNGFSKPNTLGKDVFNMTFDLNTKQFGFHNYGRGSRENYLRSCSNGENSQICGYLIYLDGWQIANDYPWF